MQQPPCRITMWSGPRNLSTAMMYAFAARPDCVVWDEPFYAAYLAQTGIAHPMAEAVLARYDTNAQAVAVACKSAPPAPVWYQKHMSQHMLSGFPLSWAEAMHNIFLIRHPARVIASYHAKYQDVTPAEVGVTRQRQIFETMAERTGTTPVVIDSADILTAPEAMLRRLCAALGIAFTSQMLSWPKGGIPQDGIWAAHWYEAVHQSTGFGTPEPPLPELPELPEQLRSVLDAVLPDYEALRRHAIRTA